MNLCYRSKIRGKKKQYLSATNVAVKNYQSSGFQQVLADISHLSQLPDWIKKDHYIATCHLFLGILFAANDKLGMVHLTPIICVIYSRLVATMRLWVLHVTKKKWIVEF